MSSSKTESYNEIFIEYGWMVLFPPAFPAAGLVAILSNYLQYRTEREAMLKYAKRCIPMSAIDIGAWLNYFELIQVIGITNGACLIIFTSQKLTYFNDENTRSWADLILAILMFENCLIIFKEILAWLIPDKPSWIEQDIIANQHRVK